MFPYIYNLLKTDLFNGLSACDLERLIDFDSCILGKYTKNTLIIQEFDNCKSIRFILEGSLSVQQLSPTGDSITLNVLKQGDSFGEGLLFPCLVNCTLPSFCTPLTVYSVGYSIKNKR